ncbi:glycosyltransferase [Paenibacillus thalictri]|uniref:glycosyltransferase n=1 Tax=Paenibacillus thalictri TaxID=2527873 RepID=UPI0013EF2F20|nr:glycosyltransferase [Paenibacillus thalictri]
MDKFLHYDHSYASGFEKGYHQGRADGTSGYLKSLEGTSVIIPVCNRKESLMAYVDSKRADANHACELIVIDNGSSDGTADYLRKSGGKLRYWINSNDIGVVGAINQGLMMARGQTLSILWNEAALTSGRLNDSQEQAGEGRTDVADIGEDAGTYGLCMPRETFRRLGYLDELFEQPEIAVMDYAVRAFLLNMIPKLPDIASVSIPHSETDRLYFRSKWGRRIENVFESGWTPDGRIGDIGAFYPTSVTVKSMGPAVYRLENNRRYKLESEGAGISATRLSQLDMKRWPLTTEVSPEHCMDDDDGSLVQTPDGQIYQISQGKLRPVLSSWVLAMWHLDRQPVMPISLEQKALYEEGIPLIAPPVIRTGFL